MHANKKFLLDTSAWFTFMEDEKGADEIENILFTRDIIIPFIVLLEVYYISFRKKGEHIASKRYAFLKSLEAEFIWKIDESTLLMAGSFKALYRISLVDAIIAAIAKRNGAILVHKDPEYEALKREIEQIILPYKR